MNTYMYIYIYVYIYAFSESKYVSPVSCINSRSAVAAYNDSATSPPIPFARPPITVPDEDVYLRLQHGKAFHNLVSMSYVKHINPASKA
jgi:hypothetical protein